MANVALQQLRKEFPTADGSMTAVDGVSFEAAGHTFVSLVGPSGCGKSTILNILAGILQPTDGSVTITNDDGSPARLAYVFQAARLLPWRTVMDNLLFVQPVVNDKVRERCREYLRMVDLGHVEKQFPGQLSGGMQQRVGIARAFSTEPDVLLMDEPFSHLDAISGRQLRTELHNIWSMTRKTVIFVTHDVGEAVELSDRVVVLAKGGRLQEIVPIDLPFPRDPANDQVALAKADLLRRFEQWQHDMAAS